METIFDLSESFKDIPTNVSLYLFLFIPGFIIYKLIEIYSPIKPLNISKSVIEIVTYGSFNFVFVFLCIILFKPESKIIWFVTFILFFPILISLISLKFLKWKKFREKVFDINPTPWDYYFANDENMFVIVTYNDNSKVGGYCGKKSRVSSYPKEKELYIEKEWFVDEEDEKLIIEVTDSNGVWINCSNIKSIKFYQ